MDVYPSTVGKYLSVLYVLLEILNTTKQIGDRSKFWVSLISAKWKRKY